MTKVSAGAAIPTTDTASQYTLAYKPEVTVSCTSQEVTTSLTTTETRSLRVHIIINHTRITFLYGGVTLAIFNLSGNIPVSIDRCQIYARGYIIPSETSFIRDASVILSYPEDFVCLRFRISLLISTESTGQQIYYYELS